MSKKTMKKFCVSLEVEGEVYVWGDDEETVKEVMDNLSVSELFDDFDADFNLSVREMPDLAASFCSDGVAVKNKGWVCLPDFKDENGEKIEPTDKDISLGHASMTELEDLGQLSFFPAPGETKSVD